MKYVNNKLTFNNKVNNCFSVSVVNFEHIIPGWGGVFMPPPNIYDSAFLRKWLRAFKPSTIFAIKLYDRRFRRSYAPLNNKNTRLMTVIKVNDIYIRIKLIKVTLVLALLTLNLYF